MTQFNIVTLSKIFVILEFSINILLLYKICTIHVFETTTTTILLTIGLVVSKILLVLDFQGIDQKEFGVVNVYLHCGIRCFRLLAALSTLIVLLILTKDIPFVSDKDGERILDISTTEEQNESKRIENARAWLNRLRFEIRGIEEDFVQFKKDIKKCLWFFQDHAKL